MLTSQEPRNGDFVAYIEQLQRESAARLRAQGNLTMVDLPQAPRGASPARAPGAMDTQGPVLDRRQADELLERLKHRKEQVAGQRASRPDARPAIALIVGALLAVYALASDGGLFALFVGIALMVWGFRRLHLQGMAGAEERRRRHKEYQQRVAETFGRPPRS